MSRKYIRQLVNSDFVYPNKVRKEYDTEIIHNIYDTCVSGSVISFSATTANFSGITFTGSTAWVNNNSKPFIQSDNQLSMVSIHMIAPGQSYFKPWRTIHNITSNNTTITGSTDSFNVTVLPSDVAVSGFTSGTYYFEFRFIGELCYLPVCYNLDLSVSPPPTPTPTPTPSITATNTPTPTITPTSATPTPTPSVTQSSGELYVYAKYISTSDELGYELNGGEYLGIGEVPTTSCDYLAVITGLTNGDSIVFSTLLDKAISGDPSDCPVSAGSCTYTHTFTGSGSNFVYITINGSNNC